MENPITRAEHEEFRRRLEEENKRQDARIGILEDSVQQIGALATSVEKLALSMQSMLKEQEKQGKRLEVLEGRDGEKRFSRPRGPRFEGHDDRPRRPRPRKRLRPPPPRPYAERRRCPTLSGLTPPAPPRSSRTRRSAW